VRPASVKAMGTHKLSRRDARRIAIRAQWLDRERPAYLLELVRQLALLTIDPTAAIAPSAHLVAWSRLGGPYERVELDRALEKRELIELRGTIRPAEDVALYRAEMELWRTGPLQGWRKAQRDWVQTNNACRRDILQRLSASGPLTSRELPDTCEIPWKSTGWTNNRNVTQMLEFLVKRGEVAIAGRQGNERLWDLADRVYPDDPVVPLAEAENRRNQRRLAALGIARSRGPECPVEPLDVHEAGEEAVVEGVRGTWRVDPELLDQPFDGRAALLSPFDGLLQDRKRMAELFEFDYVLEMYKRASARRWGYFALPILYDDRLVGKLDATADRKAGALRVNAVHWDVEPNTVMAAAVEREIGDLADWLELGLVPTA
jgi:uncharacterized protein YcaQ